MKISDVAILSSGFYFPTIKGKASVYYLQSRHFDENRQLRKEIPPELTSTDNMSKNYLLKGDVLVAAKGNEHFAAVYDGSIQPAIASSVFFVLRIANYQLVMPEYLSWYLNLPQNQQQLKGAAKGTSLPSITKRDVSDIEIPIPSLEDQQAIIKLHHLQQKEMQLTLQIQQLKKQTLQQVLLQSARRAL